MSVEEGARAQRKRLTRERIVEVATALFLEHGFDAVSVSDIAAGAGVSKMTVFNYFDTKEDIVLKQLDDGIDEWAQIVRGRPWGLSPLTALCDHFVEQVRQHEPASGLCADENVLAFRSLLIGTRSLFVRTLDQSVRSEASLAGALTELPGTTAVAARTVANQLIGTRRALIERNFASITAGGDLARLTEQAVAEATSAFGLLAGGLSDSAFGRPNS